MGLRVPLLVFVADVVLFLVIGYATLYSLQRIRRYGEPLNRFIRIISFSLFLALTGRILDILDDFVVFNAALDVLEYSLYFFSIVGVAYGIISYISQVERKILPATPVESRVEPYPGGYICESPERVPDFLSALDDPVLVITRNPGRYGNLKKASILWVTPVGEEGVPPTRLHVLIEAAVKFMRGGGRLVVIDCLEILVLYNDFPSVFKFLSSLRDHALTSGAAVLLLVDRMALGEREFRLLEREFRPIKDPLELFRTSS